MSVESAPVPDDSPGIDDVLAALTEALGTGHVVTDPGELEFYSTDIYERGERPLAVVRPADTDGVSAVAAIAERHGLSLVPRGGGASYTGGYLPTEARSLLIDVSRMNRILEINEQDMHVTVQAGVTWQQLNDALRPLGLRTPFFGPFSGSRATVGGGISQHSVSWGSGTFGVSGESVTALEVVLAGGRVLRTGTWGSATSTPFFRHYGPDFTGLFAGDVGALGIKTAITLRLLARPPEFIGLSFRFPDFDSMAAGMQAVARLGINTINFGLDPKLQQGALGRAGKREALDAALSVFRTARNPLDGLVQVMRMALAGRRFVSPEEFIVNYIVEGVDRAATRAAAAAVRRAVGRHGAETTNSVPNVVNANPYPPFSNILGPRGERWAPIHCILPFSRALSFRRELQQLYAENAERMQRHHVETGAMFMTVSTNAFLYEPVFYWQDERTPTIERMLPEGYAQRVPTYPANPEGRALVHELKLAIIELMHRHGAAHFQIGKLYPYLADRDPAAEQLLRDIKRAVDPARRINPGALGL